MGAVDVSRKAYLAMLEDALKNNDRTEHWHYSD
jgi:Leu/Phe-tRNA-protein transferase